MEDYLQRLVDEQSELSKKIYKLHVFLQSSAFEKLSAENQFLLNAQLETLHVYNLILSRRIDINTNKKELN